MTEKKTRGRPPIPVLPSPIAPITADAADVITAYDNNPFQLVGSASLAEGIGMIRAFGLIGKFTGIAQTKWFAERKESKDYKGVTIIGVEGQLIVLSTFEELCRALGTSQSQVYEDIQNLSQFGEKFLEQAQRMGLGYRDLRRLRSVPDDERLEIEGQVLNASDPDSLKDLIEEISAQHTATKKKLSAVEADLKARDTVMAEISRKYSETTAELNKLKHPRPEQREEAEITLNSAILTRIMEVSLEFTGAWNKLLAHINMALGEDATTDANTRQQIEMTLDYLMEQIANDLCSRSVHMVDFKRQVIPDWVREVRGEELDGDVE